MKKNNVVRIDKRWEETKVLLISDLHWDNPKCDRDLLKKHLDEALKGNHDILINGDLFCLMQGAYDPRKSKSDIRPEHNSANYFDAIINTAVDWFTPYAHLIKLVAYGNHETAILKRQETDIIERFVTLLNYKTGSDIQVGGYGGWTYTVEQLTQHDTVMLRDILMIRTSAYKEEYGDGSKGWHIERGASPKPIGGRWLILKPFRDKSTTRKIHAYTHKTL